ncbi:DNA cytosine methyltransferase [Cupriavidus sp. AcVe19-6a]|uniref:DNA cytosine methyltransferase n=1 Tax=Cupriavidus sp. AcVe19-6a TaxID=2821358 RepID=UPI001AE38B63|nr:DNA cytosine methyltransferase [Cupriavidus sp. AcVe19-6a]MBP0639947.1 DNA cytosine methyltransferase [Cupriavidus sp. AcVe19-6a]
MKRDSIFDIQAPPRRRQMLLDIQDKLIVDLFAGGGGMSEGIELALNRHPDFALNHNADAISMHAANHPQTHHLIADVREVNPHEVANGRTVGYLHLSPDCRDFSQAKGGQPRDRKIRALSWVGVHWAGTVRPEVISLENVSQILRWCPMIAKRDKDTGRVVKLDRTVAAKGEYVPLREQFLVPDPKRLGKTWRRFVAILRGMGYIVEWRVDRACNQGVPTFRERLIMFARCDGHPIVWPDATHAKEATEDKLAYRPAADAIDFSIAGNSIFRRKKSLAEATHRRLAVGIGRHVLNEANPFVISLTHQGGDRIRAITHRLPTVTSAHRGEFALAAPVLIQTGYGERKGQAPRVLDLKQPLGTIVAGGRKHSLGVAYLAQMNGGYNDVRGVPGRDLREPMSSITQKGSQQQLVTAHLVHLRGNCDSRSVEEPLHTISAAGQHHGLVECVLSPSDFEGAKRVAAFLRKYGVIPAGDEDDISGVLVCIDGVEYAIVDVLLRMLMPRELFNAQGFPRDYIIDRGHDGKLLTVTKQIHMCGNSVSPKWAAAYVRANLAHLILPPSHAKGAGRSRLARQHHLSTDWLAA